VCVEAWLHVFLTSAIAEVSGQLHAPAALPSGKDPGAHSVGS